MMKMLMFASRSKPLLKNRINIFHFKQYSTVNVSNEESTNILVNETNKSKTYMDEHKITLHGVTKQNQYEPMLSFNDASLSPKLKLILNKEKFDSPTPIQAISWPVVLDKKDVISVAKTGSGKTLAFLLPAFNSLLASKEISSKSRKYFTPNILILAPTRELVQQIAEEAGKYSSAGINICTAIGGSARGPQIDALRKGVHVVVATPGRCNDLAEDGALDLSNINYLVIDEADRMLDMGFEPQIRGIIDQLPSSISNTPGFGRQTLMFTATWPKSVQSLAKDFLTNPIQINIGDQNTLNANKDITQHIMIMKEFQKLQKLMELLNSKLNSEISKRNFPRTIIFVDRKQSCNDLVYELRREGFNSTALNGDKSQAMRNEALQLFRLGKIRILVATNVAARGLDVKEIEHVINFDFGGDVEDYVHRIGRTARGGSKGLAYTFISSKDLVSSDAIVELVGVLERCDQFVPPELLEIAANSSKLSSKSPSKSKHSSGGNKGQGDKYGVSRDRKRNSFGGFSNKSSSSSTSSKRSSGFNDFNDFDYRSSSRPPSRPGNRNNDDLFN